jgi:protein-S-isoprenylcysteine O-methyltransferase Ste14
MNIFRWLAALVLWMNLPIPVYWLILHPLVDYWRRHVRAALVVAAVSAWGSGTLFLFAFHRSLLVANSPPFAARLLGVALVALDLILLLQVERQMGTSRLVGNAELRQSGQLNTQGLYAHLRHPRYAGMISAMLGGCLMAGTRLLWALTAAWGLATALLIRAEERELSARFGAAYQEYCRRVPALLPLRLFRRDADRHT